MVPMHESERPDKAADSVANGLPGSSLRIPLVEESLEVGKRVVDTGRGVKAHKTVEEIIEEVDASLMRENLEVERVAVSRMVESGAAPVAHYEGDTLVIPVIEEVLIVQKHLRVVEEVRITRRREEHREHRSVPRKKERLSIERIEPSSHPKGE